MREVFAHATEHRRRSESEGSSLTLSARAACRRWKVILYWHCGGDNDLNGHETLIMKIIGRQCDGIG